ncbi:DUF4189 domain-containing protein [Acinetobacter sp. C32I]|uniref:DUF4189 domain-containing protein n=1 Tax=Acinetobacter sp. C32I TaxID=2950074 RepID=UPI002036BA5F|nr:DUF4189 domain-containing protein [Acinetobacter sp. C32I]USA54374.1 DUF4189 domain-containing protein [Acinetobacter sp. C32I]
MNKYLKHLLWLGLLGLCGSVYAEGGCPNGMTPVNNGQNWTCIPGGNDSPTQQQAAPLSQRPTGHWVKTWGAIATNGVKGTLGTAVGAKTENEAKKIAMKECNDKGGGCELEFTYHNQCAVLVTGNKIFNTAHAGSIERASEIGISQCKKEDTNCRVYYSACTEPRFVKY